MSSKRIRDAVFCLKRQKRCLVDKLPVSCKTEWNADDGKVWYNLPHNFKRHLQNPGGATSSLPVQRQIAGSEDAAPPMHEVLQVPLK